MCVRVTELLLLQAFVKVDGGGLRAALSYPLLQLFFQPANTHRAAKKDRKKWQVVVKQVVTGEMEQ